MPHIRLNHQRYDRFHDKAENMRIHPAQIAYGLERQRQLLFFPALFALFVFLAGTSLAAQTVVLTPPSLGFGSVVIGTTSPARNISLSNTGNATLSITSIAATGSFTQTNTCRNTVLPGKKCSIAVTFAPEVAGAATGTITITDNATNSPQAVSLAGTGVQPATLSPGTLNFGSRTVGTTSGHSSVTLTNNQTASLSISSIGTTGDFAQINTCGNSLAPKGKCTISLTFTPTVVGSRTGTLTVTDSASNSPQTTSLSGTGTTAGLVSIAVTPANPTLSSGATQQFTATGTFSGGRTYNLTSSVAWSSSAQTVATISSAAGSQGLATALAGGTTTILAGSGKTIGSTSLTVTSPPTLVGIVVSPTLPYIVVGDTQQFVATGTYSDGSTQDLTASVTWNSSSSAIATISSSSGSQGLGTTLADGSTTISATVGSIFSSTILTVTATSSRPVTTYHYDNYRTGWNQNESSLTPANVGSSSFGLLQSVPLDDQVEAQPLFVPAVNITTGNNQGIHDVVYVATENNSIYAIDAESGTVLLTTNFGAPVTYPLGCQDNGAHVGINSTPVIDLSSNLMYVMVYTDDGPTYRMHAIDIGSLVDIVPPVVVAASHPLTDGSTFQFNATYQKQRPALLLANGNVYAAFGGYCDSFNLSRGWLLGWQTGSLASLNDGELTDTQASSPDDYFLTSIWMSGYGPAADDAGNVLLVTGNSDSSGTTYDGITNIQESVVKMAPDLSSVLDLFTPSNQSILDQKDLDFGSGGVMVFPDQGGIVPHMAVAAGKNGFLYLMNEDSLGGYSTTGNNVLATYSIGGCWCGSSFFVDPSDLTARVVTSGGTTAEVWKVETSPAALNMVTSASVPSGQDGGFFTAVSSNGNTNAIIWALSRPVSKTQTAINLFAFDPDVGGGLLSPLFQGVAGSWPDYIGNANLVPLVANGEVFVASYQQLQIFGLGGSQLKAKRNKLAGPDNF